MEYQVKIGISNRHVHLTKETYELLFNEPLTIKKEIHQIGEFASNQVVTLKTEQGIIENVRIVGPFRDYNQVEICNSDAHQLGLNPPVRKSGDIKNSENITLVGPKGEIYLESVCILAQRHIHINSKDQEKYHVKDDDVVKVLVRKNRTALLDTHIKISENGYFEMHIDRDEANAFLLKNEENVTLIIDNNSK